MKRLIFYCSGGLGNRLCQILNIKNIFDHELYLVWPPTKRLMCEFHDLFENEDIKTLCLSELESLEDVDNYHGRQGGLVASQYEKTINLLDSLLKVSIKYTPKPIDSLNFNNLPHQNTIVFYNTFIGEVNNKIIKENFFKLKPKKEILDKIEELVDELEIDKNTVGIHARGTDFINDKVNTYFPIIENELKSGNEVFFCSDDPDWENNIRNKYPTVKIRKSKNNVYKINKNLSYGSNVMTPLDSIKDAYVDMVLLCKTNFKYFNPNSSFGRLINIIK